MDDVMVEAVQKIASARRTKAYPMLKDKIDLHTVEYICDALVDLASALQNKTEVERRKTK